MYVTAGLQKFPLDLQFVYNALIRRVDTVTASNTDERTLNGLSDTIQLETEGVAFTPIAVWTALSIFGVLLHGTDATTPTQNHSAIQRRTVVASWYSESQFSAQGSPPGRSTGHTVGRIWDLGEHP